MSKKFIKREITDAVDFLLNDIDIAEQKDIQNIEINLLENYHDHPFSLYTGKRLDDMVESIKENGILNPIIVMKKEAGAYEILSGHNRVNAAKLANLKTVPCIIKENLTQEQAYTYVIETNLMQRSFSDLLPTEKAVTVKRMKKSCSDTMRTSRAATISTRGMAARGAGFVTVTWQGIRSARNAKNRADISSRCLCITSDLLLTAARMTRVI